MSTRDPRSWFKRSRHDKDFQAEIRAHMDLETERLIEDGHSPADARDRAQRTFGNALAAEERFYEQSRWMWLDQLRQDFRYALRTLWRSRTFVSTTVLALSVGLGLLTVLFAVFNAYVLRPFAIHDPYRVYHIAWQAPTSGGWALNLREFQELRARRDLFDDAAAQRWQMVSSGPRDLQAAFVSGNYFDMLRPHVRLGRALAEFDARAPGAAAVTVLSDQGWALLFDRDPDVLGKRIELAGHSFEIVGVLQPGFAGLDDAPLDLWAPLTMLPALTGRDIYDAAHPRELTIFGRLRADVTPEQAAQALQPFMARAATDQASTATAVKAEEVRTDLRLRATPNPLTVELVALLAPIFAAFGLVLVAACANVSNVMLARAIARHREIGIRLSVGASRGRIVRQLLTEALVISALAGVTGLVLARIVLEGGRRVLFATLPASLADLMRVVPLEIDYRVFLFALGVAALATLMCALLPALQSTRLSLTDALRGQAAPGVRSGTLRNLLIGGQVAVSLVLLIMAATLARNGVSLAAVDLGYDTRGVYSINQRGEDAKLITPAAQALTLDPRVGTVAVTSQNPLFGSFARTAVQAANETTTQSASYVFVSPEYFDVLRLPILSGRGFRPNEAEAEARVGIVSARAAKALWPSADPIGQVLRVLPAQGQTDLEGYADIQIVGVAKDVSSGFIYAGTDKAMIYLPTSRTGAHAGALLVRGREQGALGREAIRQALERVPGDRAQLETMPLSDMIAIMLYPLRAASWIGSLLGLVALALAVTGLYGVLMYVLNQRTREIGIRMALGATAASVVRLVMRQSARLVGVGALIGLVLVFSTLKLLASLIRLDNVSLLDGWAFATGIAMIALAAAFATYFPARRATRIDPVHTLRADI